MAFNIIILFIPITLYIWIGYGRIYRSHDVFTKRWPSISEMNTALALPNLSSRIKGQVWRFKHLTLAYYALLVLAVASYIFLAAREAA